MKEYYSTIKIEFGGNNLEAENEEDYIQKLKDQYLEQYNIELDERDIEIERDSEQDKENENGNCRHVEFKQILQDPTVQIFRVQPGKKFQYTKNNELRYYDLKESYGSGIDSSILEGPYCTWCDRNIETIWEASYEEFEESFEEKNGREPTKEEWHKAYEEYLKTL